MPPSNTNKLRAELIAMLLHDRAFAQRENNPGAMVMASNRIVDLMIGKLADETANAAPLTTLTHVIVHQVVCPACREKQPVSETPPPPSAAEAERLRRASAWAEAEAETEPQADHAPTAPIRQPEAVVRVPKLPHQMHHRRRDPVVQGLL